MITVSAPPSAQETALAREASRRLSPFARRNQPLTVQVMEAGCEQPLELPAGAVALLMGILETMAAGNGITLIPENAELTTVQAAEILHVSRPFLIRLLESGGLPHRKVGRHRRVRMEDVMAYKQRIDTNREAILDQLAVEAQEQDMGYGRPKRQDRQVLGLMDFTDTDIAMIEAAKAPAETAIFNHELDD